MANKYTRVDDVLGKFLIICKLSSDLKAADVAKTMFNEECDSGLVSFYREFLSLLQGLGHWVKVGGVTDDLYIQNLGQILLETLGYMALKEDFKKEFLAACTKQDGKPSAFVENLNYLILSSIQYTAPSDNKKGEGEDMVQAHKLKTLSSIVFFILNMVRSCDYDTLMPSHTLKIHDQLKDKEASYYELKQLNKMMKGSP